MTSEELSELSDQELLIQAKKMKTNSFTNALLVGFLFGIIIYSILVSSVGLFTLIPLLFAFKIINQDKNNTALKNQLKERNLS